MSLQRRIEQIVREVSEPAWAAELIIREVISDGPFCAKILQNYWRQRKRQKTHAHSSEKIPRSGIYSINNTKNSTDKNKDSFSENSENYYSEDFLSFWTRYPKKIGKGSAYELWKRRRPPLARVHAALDWQLTSARWTKEGGEYIPNPSTYLSQRRWEDEPPAPQEPKSIYRDLDK